MCSSSNLCSDGSHVCTTQREFALKSSTGDCDDASNNDPQTQGFFVSASIDCEGSFMDVETLAQDPTYVDRSLWDLDYIVKNCVTKAGPALMILLLKMCTRMVGHTEEFSAAKMHPDPTQTGGITFYPWTSIRLHWTWCNLEWPSVFPYYYCSQPISKNTSKNREALYKEWIKNGGFFHGEPMCSFWRLWEGHTSINVPLSCVL